MRESRSQVLVRTEAKKLALLLSVSILSLTFISFTPARAEEVQDPETTNPAEQDQTTQTVAAPGTPSATSSAEDKNIIWVWTAPAGGLTPDAPPADSEVPEVSEPATTAYPTDIVQYGYELTLQDAVVTSGVVDAGTTSVITPVSADGTYTLKVWSINRADEKSAPAIGSMTIVTPVPELPPLPPIEEGTIPTPIDTKPLISNPITQSNKPASSSSRPFAGNTSASVSPRDTDSGVLSANNLADTISNVAKTDIARPSSQGWMIIGIPWYLWLIAGAALFTTWRMLKIFVVNRR